MQANINASVESDPKRLSGMNQPIVPVIAAGSKITENIRGNDISSFCVGFRISASLTCF